MFFCFFLFFVLAIILNCDCLETLQYMLKSYIARFDIIWHHLTRLSKLKIMQNTEKPLKWNCPGLRHWKAWFLNVLLCEMQTKELSCGTRCPELKKRTFRFRPDSKNEARWKKETGGKHMNFFIFPFWKLLLTFKHIFFRLTLKLHVFMLQRFGNLFKHEHSWFSFWKFIFLVSKWQLYFFILIPALSLRLRASLRWPKPWFQIFFQLGITKPTKRRETSEPKMPIT